MCKTYSPGLEKKGETFGVKDEVAEEDTEPTDNNSLGWLSGVLWEVASLYREEVEEEDMVEGGEEQRGGEELGGGGNKTQTEDVWGECRAEVTWLNWQTLKSKIAKTSTLPL